MRKRKDRAKAAFTLIEVLVATFILVVLILMLGKIYHQASVAWSSGFRRAEGNMTGRSAVGFMAREIMNSCSDELLTNTCIESDSIEFITLTGESKPNERIAKWVKYYMDGDALMREEKYPNTSGANSYGDLWSSYSPEERKWCLVTNVVTCSFDTPGGVACDDGDPLPAWVKIRLTLSGSDDVSAVGAASAGPDGILGGSGSDDDIRSY